MGQMHELVKLVLNHHEPAVLATIIHVDGSAYRREGASMLIKKNGTRIGLLSGGCLETDVHLRAEEIFGSKDAEIFQYDLSAEDDLSWGPGAGCNGILSVLIRDIDPEFRRLLARLNEHLLNKEPVLFIQSTKNLNKYGFVSKSGEVFENGNGTFPLKHVDFLQNAAPFHKYAALKSSGEDSFFLQLIWPKPELFIIGAGEDARPFAQLASETGYAVHMLDWREAFCTKEHFSSAQSVRVGEIEQLVKSISFHPLDSVVIMTHDFQRDAKVINELKKQPLFYAGVLGSKKRTERLIRGQIPDWLHSPVGLSIGAEGPEEIAISIMAEMIAKRRRKTR